MENLNKAFMPGYITTSLNGKVIEVVKAEVTEAEQKVVKAEVTEIILNSNGW